MCSHEGQASYAHTNRSRWPALLGGDQAPGDEQCGGHGVGKKKGRKKGLPERAGVVVILSASGRLMYAALEELGKKYSSTSLVV